jgi:signal transduction histidine kinase
MPTNESDSGEPMLQRHAPFRHLLTVTVHGEIEVIASRLRARQIAALCGFPGNEQTRIATAVSELARNAVSHAAVGKVRFFLGTVGRKQALTIVVDDEGEGIPAARIQAVLEDNAGGTTGGLSAARRFMDEFAIDTDAGGTRIVCAKTFPAHAPSLSSGDLVAAVSRLAELPGNIALSEANQQNRELTQALAALQAKQSELMDVSAHLERTNRQVEALNVLLKEKADSLVSADRRKDEFLSILSHELRGPLSAAGMAATLLEAGGNPDQSIKLGQLVGRQVRHMSRLVEDLLDVSRVSRGLVSIRRQPVDMRDVIGAAVEQLAAAAQSKGHLVRTVLPSRPCTVEGDHTRLIQVAANLLGNAIRYTPAGGKIEMLAEQDEADLLVRVTDNGIGIPSTLMPHLFDLYTQAEHSSNGRNSGLGLGLALVKSLVEAHGGSVVASSLGTGLGSRFEVRLPLAIAQAE